MLKKIRRMIESPLPVQKGRRGKCVPDKCDAACCRLPVKCVFLSKQNWCMIYSLRSPQCRRFPRCERDLNDVKECGFVWD